MISKACFDSKYIKKKHKEIRTDPILIEKTMCVFELLANLVENGVDLVFKGGTSLLLLLPALKRLSIDLDIVTSEGERKLERVFGEIAGKGLFTRWGEDQRRSKHEIPKKHFKFHYLSRLSNKEDYVLLDVLRITAPFPRTLEKSILSPIFDVDKEVKVRMPTIDGLAGDKLTAFAPTTIGIRYGTGRSMEIVKQLLDLGILFEYVTNLAEILSTYDTIAGIESNFRNITMDIERFLNDSIEAAFLISQLDFKSSIEDKNTEEMRNGIRSINTHTVERYSFLNAKEDASKIACLASLLKGRRTDVDVNKLRRDRFDTDKIKDMELPGRYAILNKLKSISPESFHLWAVAFHGGIESRSER